MPHAIASKPLTRAALGVALAAASAFALTGCGAGQVTQTDTMVAAVPGTSADLTKPGEGIDIALRDAYIEFAEDGYAAGESAPLSIRIFNSGKKADTLTKVEFPESEAAGVTVAGEGSGEASETPSDSDSPSDKESPSDSESPSDKESASGSESPSDEASASEKVTSKVDLELPVDGKLLLAPDGEQYLELTGLKQDLKAGDIVTITFVFAEAGEVDMDIPVAPPAEGAERDEPAEHGEGH